MRSNGYVRGWWSSPHRDGLTRSDQRAKGELYVRGLLTEGARKSMQRCGLSMINADFSNTSFRVSHATIGERNFLGNIIFFPPGARTGENGLLATKVMVPISGRTDYHHQQSEQRHVVPSASSRST